MKHYQSVYRKILSYDPLGSWVDNTHKNLANLDYKIKGRLFIFSEYLKRRFYLDCNKSQDNGSYIYRKDNKTLYTDIDKKGIYNLLKYACGTFLHSNSNEINIDDLSNPYINNPYVGNDLLSIFRHIYLGGYKKIYEYITAEIKKYNPKDRNANIIHYDYLYKNPYTFFTYERILSNLASMNNQTYKMPDKHNPFGILVKDISTLPIIKDNKEWFTLYGVIVRRYHLYICDLLSISDMYPYIFANRDIDSVPIFIDLPKLPSMQILPFYLSANFDSTTSEFNINIKNCDSIKIDEVLSQVSKYLACELYRTKLDSDGQLSDNDIDCLTKFLDVPNERNSENDFTDRLIGLYLWDKCYRTKKQNTLSQRSIIENFIKSYRKTNNKVKTLRQYQRVLNATKNSIEQGQYLPLV